MLLEVVSPASLFQVLHYGLVELGERKDHVLILGLLADLANLFVGGKGRRLLEQLAGARKHVHLKIVLGPVIILCQVESVVEAKLKKEQPEKKLGARTDRKTLSPSLAYASP